MGCSSSVHATPPRPRTQAAEQGSKPQPITPDSRLLRGQAHYAAGRTEEALKELNGLIAAWPGYARAYLERGNIRFEARDYSPAIGDYSTALQLQENLLQAYLMRCRARLALRQFAEALADAKAAERLDPDNAQVKTLKVQVRKAQAATSTSPRGLGGGAEGGGGRGGGCGNGGGGACGEEEDVFAAVDTPKSSTPSASVRKLCMVCMDSERECRLRPCMHAAMCVTCAEGLRARGYGCPICSSRIESVERGSFLHTFTVEEAQGIVSAARNPSSAPSPGKSPLGRRFAPGNSLPSLDGILEEVDEEGHAIAIAIAAATRGDPGRAVSRGIDSTATSATNTAITQMDDDMMLMTVGGANDSARATSATIATAASIVDPATAAAMLAIGGPPAGVTMTSVTSLEAIERVTSSLSASSSSGGAGGGGGMGGGDRQALPPPPVVLDPHPLASRAAIAAAAAAGGGGGAGGRRGEGQGDTEDPTSCWDPGSVGGVAAEGTSAGGGGGGEGGEPSLPGTVLEAEQPDGAVAAAIVGSSGGPRHVSRSSGGGGGGGGSQGFVHAAAGSGSGGGGLRIDVTERSILDNVIDGMVEEELVLEEGGSGGGDAGRVHTAGGARGSPQPWSPVGSPPAAFSPDTSAQISHSLADWIDGHLNASPSTRHLHQQQQGQQGQHLQQQQQPQTSTSRSRLSNSCEQEPMRTAALGTSNAAIDAGPYDRTVSDDAGGGGHEGSGVDGGGRVASGTSPGAVAESLLHQSPSTDLIINVTMERPNRNNFSGFLIPALTSSAAVGAAPDRRSRAGPVSESVCRPSRLGSSRAWLGVSRSGVGGGGGGDADDSCVATRALLGACGVSGRCTCNCVDRDTASCRGGGGGDGIRGITHHICGGGGSRVYTDDDDSTWDGDGADKRGRCRARGGVLRSDRTSGRRSGRIVPYGGVCDAGGGGSSSGGGGSGSSKGSSRGPGDGITIVNAWLSGL